MAYLLGTDEAGYGPNLGPLVVSVTAWRVPDELKQVELYEVLRHTVSHHAERRAGKGLPRVVLCDSKSLYQPGSPQGLVPLELGLLASLAAVDCRPANCRELSSALSCEEFLPGDLPWHDGFSLDLPVEAEISQVAKMSTVFCEGLAAAHVELKHVRSRAIHPERFNLLTNHHGSKGGALSQMTLELLAEVLPLLEEEPIFVVCDKHGGRDHYAPLLQEYVTESPVRIVSEGRDCSVYRWGKEDRRTEVRFQVGGERALPTALASMACKYLRELAMRAFNEFWLRQVPGLKATAGYPLDARRFKAEIAGAQRRLGILDEVLWRAR